MPSIKIYPPTQLPDRAVSETQFSIWCEELEVYLAQEDEFTQFLSEGKYATWQSKEHNPERITQFHEDDFNDPDLNTPAARNAKLRSVRTKLRTVLAIIGKVVSEGHYNTVIRHSTSLQWIYDTLKADYDIQQRGIHFFNILDVKYDQDKATPVSFYNRYRTVIINNLAKRGDVIKYKGQAAITEDERISPMLEDLILLNVLREIDPRLPGFIKAHYNHKMQRDDMLMDFKSDMLVNVPSFIEQINGDEQNNSIKSTASLNTFKQQKFGNGRRPFNKQKSKLYCRLCYLEKLPRDVFTSHNFGDVKCPSISQQDKTKMHNNSKLSNMTEYEELNDENELAEMFGYGANVADESSGEEVVDKKLTKFSNNSCRLINAKHDFIQPVPSQILTVFETLEDTMPIHIDLDSGATLNYCTEKKFLIVVLIYTLIVNYQN